MSFQRPSFGTTGASPSSASYSEFLKDIYSSLRTLSTGLATINTRLDNMTSQLQSFESRLASQDQQSQILANKLDTLIQQRENSQIRQTTSGLSLLSELDTLGTRQVEPSTAVIDIATRLQTTSRISANRMLFDIPEINITEDELSASTATETNNLSSELIEQDNSIRSPSTTAMASQFMILE